MKSYTRQAIVEELLAIASDTTRDPDARQAASECAIVGQRIIDDETTFARLRKLAGVDYSNQAWEDRFARVASQQAARDAANKQARAIKQAEAAKVKAQLAAIKQAEKEEREASAKAKQAAKAKLAAKGKQATKPASKPLAARGKRPVSKVG